MNILYLSNHLNTGGITSYILSLAKGLKERGHNVCVASSAGDCLDRFIREGISYIAIPINTKAEISPKILFSFFKLLGYIKEKDIQIIHANTRVTQVLACLLQKYSGRIYVYTCHGFFKPKLSRRLFPCWGRLVIAISRQVSDHLRNDFKVGQAKIRIIHNGIDLERFAACGPEAKSAAKEKFGLSGAKVIGIIARLSDVKGHVYLIRAMPEVLEKIPDARLLIVGEGREKAKLAALAAGLGITKSVFFLPSVADTAEALSAMDIFVMPSLKEGLGLSLMEAMSCGLPVIGSNVGGIKTLIRHGENGLLVEPADSDSLCAAMLELLQDRFKAEALGKEARVFIQSNFSQEKMLIETEEVYKECLSVKD
ncbi:MAG: glycosyltransferase family 4 protein [Candidatus Omnitrophica bacterium]|nr:glycosyltransferase family 4 protein [Candidatus Omnitrophota bacterium]